jgi:hypothetical protein
MMRFVPGKTLSALASLHASPLVCCFAGLILFAAPVALVAPVRAAETNNTLPAEEETKSSSHESATHNQTRHRSRHSAVATVSVLKAVCTTTSCRAPLPAPNGLSEHVHRAGLGTPLRC